MPTRLAVWSSLLLAIAVPAPALAAGSPVRLQVVAGSPAYATGAEVALTVRALDVNDQLAEIPPGLELSIQLKAEPPGGGVYDLDEASGVQGADALRSGAAERTVRFSPKVPGLWRIVAKNANVVDGSCVFEAIQPELVRPPVVETPVVIARPRVSPMGGLLPSTDRPPVVTTPTVTTPTVTTPTVTTPTVTAPTVTAPTVTAEPARPFGLYFNVDAKRVVANGTAAATIEARVIGMTAAPADLDITLDAEGCVIDPNPVRIPAGGKVGRASVRRSSIGDVTIRLVDALPPPGREQEGLPRDVHFVPPITGCTIEVPSEVTVGETKDLLVVLKAEGPTTIDSDKDRDVTLSATGPITLATSDLKILSGKSSASTRFTVQGAGPVTFVAHLSDFPSARATSNATIPVLPFALGAVGGLVGGGVACIQRNRPRARAVLARLAIGVVTGFLLYWLVSVGLVATSVGPAVNHPVGAIAVALVGGWVGTGVLVKAASVLGIVKADAPDA